MPKKVLHDVTNTKLLYAKQFYLEGEKHAREQNPIDRMIAIHHFHIAVEIALKAKYALLFSSKDLMDVNFNTVKQGVRDNK